MQKSKETGLMDSVNFVDSLVLDCDKAVAAIIHGDNILWCRIMYEMVRKLGLLKAGIANDIKSREDTIDALVKQLNEMGVKTERLPLEELAQKYGQISPVGGSGDSDEETGTKSQEGPEGRFCGKQRVSMERAVKADGQSADIRAGHDEGSQATADSREFI